MRLLDITEAKHFCRPLGGYVPGLGQSLAAFHDSLRITRLAEGTTPFDVHRTSLLNAVERWILFGVAGYRRALDMFVPGNAPWAQVTLYYSSFFAANAILGMFGVWSHFQRLIDVDNGVPNSQIFRIDRRAASPSGYQGSHQRFWDFFYEGCNTIGPWVPAKLQSVMTPVNHDRTWQIAARNEVNYDMFVAFDAAVQFNTTFKPKRLKSVTGPLAQQLEVTEGMLKVALYFAKYLGLSSFAFQQIASGERAKVLRAIVTKAPPGLVTQSVLQELLQ